MTKRILSNQVLCLKCGDTPYSAHTRDFKYCQCGNVAVDGGMDYLRRVGGESGYVDLSIEMDRDKVAYLKIAISNALERKSNSLGILCAVMIGMRDWDRKIKNANDTDKPEFPHFEIFLLLMAVICLSVLL